MARTVRESRFRKIDHGGAGAEAAGADGAVGEAEGEPDSARDFGGCAEPQPNHQTENKTESGGEGIEKEILLSPGLPDHVKLP